MLRTRDSDNLSIQDYLDATSQAAARTRWVTGVMIVTCMFVFAGLLNSLQTQWMGERIREINNDPYGTYVQAHLGPAPQTPDRMSPAWNAYERHLDAFYSHLARAYVETGFVIRVPVVGFTFDVNDLGLIGGLAFTGIMVTLRFSLTREVDNVRVAFDAAARMNQLDDFYRLLAMHQVFTVPHSHELRRTRFLVWLPKAVCGLPFVLQGCVAGYDLFTSGLGFDVSWNRTFLVLLADFGTLMLIAGLTPMAVSRLMLLDSIWEDSWLKVMSGSSTAGPCAAPSAALPSTLAGVEE